MPLLGLAEGAADPHSIRGQVNALEDDQKRRATRSLRDGIDRVLTDLQSLFRDVVMIQYGREAELVNRERLDALRALAGEWTPARTLGVLDRISLTRRNLEQNAAPLLALESLMITVANGSAP